MHRTILQKKDEQNNSFCIISGVFRAKYLIFHFNLRYSYPVIEMTPNNTKNQSIINKINNVFKDDFKKVGMGILFNTQSTIPAKISVIITKNGDIKSFS